MSKIKMLTVACCGWCGVIEGLEDPDKDCVMGFHEFNTSRPIPRPVLLAALLKQAGAQKVEMGYDGTGRYGPRIIRWKRLEDSDVPAGPYWILAVSEDTP